LSDTLKCTSCCCCCYCRCCWCVAVCVGVGAFKIATHDGAAQQQQLGVKAWQAFDVGPGGAAWGATRPHFFIFYFFYVFYIYLRNFLRFFMFRHLLCFALAFVVRFVCVFCFMLLLFSAVLLLYAFLLFSFMLFMLVLFYGLLWSLHSYLRRLRRSFGAILSYFLVEQLLLNRFSICHSFGGRPKTYVSASSLVTTNRNWQQHQLRSRWLNGVPQKLGQIIVM